MGAGPIQVERCVSETGEGGDGGDSDCFARNCHIRRYGCRGVAGLDWWAGFVPGKAHLARSWAGPVDVVIATPTAPYGMNSTSGSHWARGRRTGLDTWRGEPGQRHWSLPSGVG